MVDKHVSGSRVTLQLRYLLLQLHATGWQDLVVRMEAHVYAVMLHCGLLGDVAMRGDPLDPIVNLRQFTEPRPVIQAHQDRRRPNRFDFSFGDVLFCPQGSQVGEKLADRIREPRDGGQTEFGAPPVRETFSGVWFYLRAQPGDGIFHEFIAPEDLLISDVRRAVPRIVENFRNCAGAFFQQARNVQASKERSLRRNVPGSGPAKLARRRMPEVARRVLHRVAQLEVSRQPNYFWVARRPREAQSPRRKLQRPLRACFVGEIYERIWALDEMDGCFPGRAAP